jgi:hypothetical protein
MRKSIHSWEDRTLEKRVLHKSRFGASRAGLSTRRIRISRRAAPGGFNTLKLTNDYITLRDILVTNKGFTNSNSQRFDVQCLPQRRRRATRCVGRATNFNNLNPAKQNAWGVSFWNEFDWFTGISLNLFETWTAGVKCATFRSPLVNFATVHDTEFNLSYDDNERCITVKLFFTNPGDSNSGLRSRAGGYPHVGFPCPPIAGNLDDTNQDNVRTSHFLGRIGWLRSFSPEIEVSTPLAFVPQRCGAWSCDAGVQYYNLATLPLLDAQQFSGAVVPIGRISRHLRLCCSLGVLFRTCRRPAVAA